MTAPRNDPYLQPLQYAIAGPTSIPCTKWSRRVEIMEDGAAGNGQGIVVTYPNGTVAVFAPQQQPVILADLAAQGSGGGRFLGRPPQTDGAPLYDGDIYVVVDTAGTATVVNVWEYD